ncbi:histidinol-phosphate transaminase [Phenylobacterium sp.]|uniref:histidinol-phosphate transaminase n=1 Tax=Phenylobacterium sp. TaxID=1871053 RepID=UPI0025FE61B8|nr:histidinol-phosphate transaminase [Phenylobacterium sp.]
MPDSTDLLAPADPRAQAPKPLPKPGILDIHAYVPGKSKAEGVETPIKLSSNENILGSSPAARAAFVAAVDSLHLYPDSRASELRAAVAAHFDLEPDRLVFGDGTDEVLHLLNQVFLEPGDNIVMGQYGFSAYSIGARACQAQVRQAAEPGYHLSVEAMLAAVDARTRLVFVTQPGNPTGTFLTRDELRALHAGLPASVVLVLDGAYAEFATDPRFDDGLELARAQDNVVVTRTFSKLHGLAALRIGWAYCPAPIADAVDRIRAPFNTSIAAQQAAVAALADVDFQARSREHVAYWRPWLTQQFGGLGLEVVASQANFVLVGFPTTPGRTAAEAEAWLARRGLIVRGVGNYGLPDHLRITIGLEEHNRAVADALAEFMKA